MFEVKGARRRCENSALTWCEKGALCGSVCSPTFPLSPHTPVMCGPYARIQYTHTHTVVHICYMEHDVSLDT